MKLRTLTIIGVGLIGGSIGLAAKARGLARWVCGVGRRKESLDEARARGTIDKAFLDPQPALADADIAVFCTPVDRIAEQVVQYSRFCPRGALLTDVGSTKKRILESIAGRLRADVHFVGSHPLAGSEKRGPEHADADLFQDRWTVVTPTPDSDPAAVERTQAFWEALGSRVRRMSPEDLDQALALTSHLPHLVAAALASTLPRELFELTASGFRDTTRIASGDPALWTAIFDHNCAALLAALDRFSDQLGSYRRALEQDNPAAIDALLSQAKKVRDALGNRNPA